MTVRTVGVEEELLLVEPETGQPRAVAGTVLEAVRQAAADSGPGRSAAAGAAAEALDFELQLQQLETNTRPCRGLDDLGRELRRCRADAAEAAARAGVQVAALATSPVPVEPELVGKSRYREMARAFGLTAYEQLTCGCHVHVGVSSDEEGVAALDRIGPWLAVLLALSANSPFWHGRDSAYASFRYQVQDRWPSAGPTDVFGSAAAYRDTVAQMVGTGTLLDTGMVYFDARLSQRYPTLEIRIADVCLNEPVRPERCPAQPAHGTARAGRGRCGYAAWACPWRAGRSWRHCDRARTARSAPGARQRRCLPAQCLPAEPGPASGGPERYRGHHALAASYLVTCLRWKEASGTGSQVSVLTRRMFASCRSPMKSVKTACTSTSRLPHRTGTWRSRSSHSVRAG
jgi:YbdK family carboxylate-amine ligase